MVLLERVTKMAQFDLIDKLLNFVWIIVTYPERFDRKKVWVWRFGRIRSSVFFAKNIATIDGIAKRMKSTPGDAGQLDASEADGFASHKPTTVTVTDGHRARRVRKKICEIIGWVEV